jgi:hypothetical protein
MSPIGPISPIRVHTPDVVSHPMTRNSKNRRTADV